MGTHVRGYDGTSAPRLADFGGIVWMLADARARALGNIGARTERVRGPVDIDGEWPQFDRVRYEAWVRNLRVAMRDA